MVYVNMLGGQDELVFDGNSFVMDGAGKVVMRAPPFEEGLYPVEFERVGRRRAPGAGDRRARARRCRERVSRAGAGRARLRRQARFPGVVMGLSGGIDSALDARHRRRCAGQGHACTRS